MTTPVKQDAHTLVTVSPARSKSTVQPSSSEDLNNPVHQANSTISQLEKKKAEYEYLKEQRRRFEAEMELYDIQIKGAQTEYSRLSQEVGRNNNNNSNNYAGHQSEPTTPPEYRDQGFPSAFSRPQRYSMQGLTSPQQQGFQSDSSRPGSQITSPPQHFHQGISHMPSKSMPGSRRGSDEEEDNYEFDVSTMNPRSGAAGYVPLPFSPASCVTACGFFLSCPFWPCIRSQDTGS